MDIRKLIFFMTFVLTALVFSAPPAQAKQYNIFGKNANLFWYLTQQVQFSMHKHDYCDTEQDLQGAITNFLIEGDFSFTDELKVYASGGMTVDWIYDLKHDDHSWETKGFDKSRDRLYKDTKSYQMLKECHVTWTPGQSWYFRVGKQIDAWGELLGLRITDVINPIDQRRGFADIEFESTLIPIWLIRTEYYPENLPNWVQDLGLEFVLNLNPSYITDDLGYSGTTDGGIWAPNVEIVPDPFGVSDQGMRVSSSAGRAGIQDPANWSHHEYGFRLKTLLYDTFLTFMYFYGYENRPLERWKTDMPILDEGCDGWNNLHAYDEGDYPLFRMIGFTVARDIPQLAFTFLGGVAPLFRIEARYVFDRSYYVTDFNGATLDPLTKSDEVWSAITCDWKVRIRWLNPRDSIVLSPQFDWKHIRDYDNNQVPNIGAAPRYTNGQQIPSEENEYSFGIMTMTSYYHNKIMPMFFWIRDLNSRSYFWKGQVTYARNNNWNYTAGAMNFWGKEEKAFQLFENKGYFFFKVAYKWG